MALQLKLKNTNTINAEGNKIFLEDATGVYDAVTNSGGYGIPNQTRESMALLVLGLNKTTKGNVVIELDSYNPLTAISFVATVGRDGWYLFNLLSLPFYDEEQLNEYNDGEVFYDTVLSKPVKITDTITTTTTTIGGVVVSIPFITRTAEEIALVELADSEYIITSIDTFFVANNSKVKLKINTQINNLIYNGADFADKKLTRQKDNYNAVRAILQGSIYEYCRGNKFVAQKNIEFLNNNNYVLN